VIHTFRQVVIACVLVMMATVQGSYQPVASASPLPGPGIGVDAAPTSLDLQRSAKKKKKKSKDSDTSESSAASASPSPSGSYLGVWTDGSTAQAGRLDDLGVGWARVVAVWSAIEPSDNAFNFSDLDAQVNAASGGGRRQVLVMVRNNPAWAASSRCKVTTDTEQRRLADFLTALVNRYKDRVGYWQLYNEMDNTSEAFDRQNDLGGCFGTASGSTPTRQGREEYARTLAIVGTAIHRADSRAKVVTGAMVSGNHLSPAHPDYLFDADFAKGVLAKLKDDGALDQLDYVAVHFFSSQAADYNNSGSDLLGRVEKLRQDMRDAGLNAKELKPIMVDEGSYTSMIGQSTSDPGDGFNRAQRDYVVKALSRAAAADVVYFWFWLRDIAGGGLGGDNAYGLLAADGSAKPSYASFRYFTSLVGGTGRLVGRLTPADTRLEGYEFSLADGRHVQVIWNNADGDQISYSPNGKLMSVSDPVGTQISSTGSAETGGGEPRFGFTRS